MNEYVVTRSGYDKMIERYNYLTTTKRDEVGNKLSIARGFGDFRENSEFDAARTEQANIEQEIMELEVKIRKAVIVDSSDIDLSKVGVGCTVRLYDEEFEEEIEYKIVGTTESNPAEGLISYISPVGQALIGKSKGDLAIAETPNGEIRFKILDILNK